MSRYLEDSATQKKQKVHRHTDTLEKQRPQKRRREEEDDEALRSRAPSKKQRLETYNETDSSTPKINGLGRIHESPFAIQTSSLYLPVSPITQHYPINGICAEHLSPLILTYYPPLKGMVMAYDNIRLSEPGSGVVIDGRVMARSQDENGVSYVWVTVDFLLLRPTREIMIDAWINLQTESHLGLVCWNLFNASIERKFLPKDWQWVDGGSTGRFRRRGSQASSQENSEEDDGYYVAGDGQKVDGAIRFRVRDFDFFASSGKEREKSFLGIEGTLLSADEEAQVLKEERRRMRHSLPPANVLWKVSSSHGNVSPTIADFVEEVNAKIPLDGSGWGLDDYVVRVEGYECLHYEELDQILQDGDHVIDLILRIEPLQSSDLRACRLGGRHQISTDGRHLIDGVAYGRRWNGQLFRPPVRIPSRKRVSYTNYENGDTEHGFPTTGQDGDYPQLEPHLLETYNEQEDDDDDEDDADWATIGPGEELEDASQEDSDEDMEWTPDRHTLQEEAEALAQEAAGDSFHTGHAASTMPRAGRRTAASKGILKPAKNSENRVAYSTKRKKNVDFVPVNSSTSAEYQTAMEGLRAHLDARTQIQLWNRQRIQDHGIRTVERSEIARLSSSDSDSDRDFSGSSSDSDLSTSGSSVNDNSSESEESPEEPEVVTRIKKSKHDKLTSSESTNEQGEAGDKLRRRDVGKGKKLADTESRTSGSGSTSSAQPPISIETLTDQKDADDSESKPGQPQMKPPGQGKKATQTRNRRRKQSKLRKSLVAQGLLPENATTADLRNLQENIGKDHISERWENVVNASSTGGVDVNGEGTLSDRPASKQEGAFEHDSGKETLESTTARPSALFDSPSPPFSTAREAREEMNNTEPMDSGKENVVPENNRSRDTLVSQAPAKPSMKLDLAASRRLLLGSLGLRTPKNKADEDELRSRLQIQGHAATERKAVIGNTIQQEGEFVADDRNNPNYWEQRIKLFVVECDEEAVRPRTLTSPSVGLSDQQRQPSQENPKSGGKRKKRKRNDAKYTQDAFEEERLLNDQRRLNWRDFDITQMHSGNFILDYGEVEASTKVESPNKVRRIGSSDKDTDSPGMQLLNETKVDASTRRSSPSVDADEEDLPPLPADLSTLPDLAFSEVASGAVIAFRRLEMSPSTNYQPILSPYRTAHVNTIDLLTQYISLRLAKRDREDQVTKYDKKGNKIYGKFDLVEDSNEEGAAPDDESPGNGEDAKEDSTLEVSFAELVEPKLVQAAKLEVQVDVNGRTEHADVVMDVDANATVDDSDASEDFIGLEESEVVGHAGSAEGNSEDSEDYGNGIAVEEWEGVEPAQDGSELQVPQASSGEHVAQAA